MKKKLIVLSSSILSFAPFMALAQGAAATTCSAIATNDGTLKGVICKVGSLLSTLIPVLVVVGVVYFIWGVVQFVVSSDEESKTKGRTHMIYGIIGLVVIIGMWGLVGIVMSTFNLGSGGLPINSLPSVGI